ncbi:hypothetical protein SLS62_011435, partial [Diatrype stigma]
FGHYLQLPDGISEWRARLGGFTEGSVGLTGDEYTSIFPYVSNVWSRHDGGELGAPKATNDFPYETHEYRCCFWKILSDTTGNGLRNKGSTTVKACKTKLKVTIEFVKVDGVVTEDATLQFFGQHRHSLEDCDIRTHNNAIKTAFQRYIEIGCNMDLKLALQQWNLDTDSQEAAREAGMCKKINYNTLRNWKTVIQRTVEDISMRQGDWGEQLDDAYEFCLEAGFKVKKVSAVCTEKSNKKGGGAIELIPPDAEYNKKRTWLKNKLSGEFERWATYARHHIPALLQISTTSPLEGFHSHLKNGFKKIMRVWALQEAVNHTIKIGLKWHDNANFEALVNSSRKLLLLEGCSAHLGRLPASLQALTMNELRVAQKWSDEDVSAFYQADVQNLRCPCKHWRQWRIPCRHLWLKHLQGDRISQQQFGFVVERLSNGYKTYELEWDDPLFDEALAAEELAEQLERNVSLRSVPSRFASIREDIFDFAEQLQQRFYDAQRISLRLPPNTATIFMGLFHKAVAELPVQQAVAIDLESLVPTATAMPSLPEGHPLQLQGALQRREGHDWNNGHPLQGLQRQPGRCCEKVRYDAFGLAAGQKPAVSNGSQPGCASGTPNTTGTSSNASILQAKFGGQYELREQQQPGGPCNHLQTR